MKIFGAMYDKTMVWAKHRYANFFLCLTSFIEAIFFPIPPDVMLIPMAMAKPKQATKLAFYAASASLLGGFVGYGLGYFATDWVQVQVAQFGYQAQWETAINWLERWGILVVFVVAFSPIPYKIFTICAGVMQMSMVPFLFVGFIARLARFLLVAKLAAWGGEKFADKLQRYIEIIGWAVIALALAVYLIFR